MATSPLALFLVAGEMACAVGHLPVQAPLLTTACQQNAQRKLKVEPCSMPVLMKAVEGEAYASHHESPDYLLCPLDTHYLLL